MKKQIIFKLISAVLAISILVSCAPHNNGTISSTSAEKEWVLGKAYIPENNPAPVLINREDAAVLTPISFTDKKIGRRIKVDAKNITTFYAPKVECDSHIAIIRSHNELKAIYDQEGEYLRDDERYINFYDVEHFNDNVIIMVIVNNGTSASRHRIDKVTKSGSRMYIYWNNADASAEKIYSGGIDCSRTLISVSKKDIENIKDVVVYMDKIFCD